MAITGLTDNPQAASESLQSDEVRLLNTYLEQTNIAPMLDDQVLIDMGQEVVENYEIDEDSRREWMERNEDYLRLATQIVEAKNTPWPNAANIKYPLLTTAALQFSARAYPALIMEPTPVKAKVIGEDPDGIKAESAHRVTLHMSYQLLDQMDDWEEDMDKLTFILPIIGTCFKKTYFSSILKRNVSQLVLPKDLIVNYYATSLETAERITHKFELSDNDIRERVHRQIFLDVDLGLAVPPKDSQRRLQDEQQGLHKPAPNKHPPRTILEQHCYWDLDGDGYKEPYIVTVDLHSKKVLRVVANYHMDTIELDAAGKLLSIKPVEYFTKFSFIPNPDGGFYDLGFGVLLGPLNNVANTLINQLLDAGKLSNLPSGFIARGIRFKGGRKSISPGEWVPTMSSGDDLRKGIVPLPTKEPSMVLFQLLGSIIESGQKISSIADIMMGINPGQNQPATTTMAVLEQGLKVFTAIHKRIYRSLTKEFKKLYSLNRRYVTVKEYFTVLDSKVKDVDAVMAEDYSKTNLNIMPTADPKVVTEAQRLIKAQMLMQLMEAGLALNQEEVTLRMLEATDQTEIDKLMKPNPPAQPPPEIQIEMAKLQQSGQKLYMDALIQRIQAQGQYIANLASADLSIAQAEAQKVMNDLQTVDRHLELLRTMFDAQVAQQQVDQQGQQQQQANSSQDQGGS